MMYATRREEFWANVIGVWENVQEDANGVYYLVSPMLIKATFCEYGKKCYTANFVERDYPTQPDFVYFETLEDAQRCREYTLANYSDVFEDVVITEVEYKYDDDFPIHTYCC